MIWPFRRAPEPRALEARQAGPYTDAIARQIIATRTEGVSGDAGDTAALEAAAGVVARAFASATVEPETPALTPLLLASIGRDLIVRGEALVVEVGRAMVRATSWDIGASTPDEMRWSYNAQIPTPDGHRTVMRTGAECAHPRYSADAEQPWHGVPPLRRASEGARLAGSIEKRVADEAGAAVGHLLPIPAGAGDEQTTLMKADLRRMAGETALVETTSGGWGEGRTAAPQADYKPQRIGAAWPPSTPPIYRASQIAVLAACGVPVELIEKADGTGQREAWRRCLHGTIEPLGRIVASELTWVVGRPVTLSFERLFASDIQGRARAFQSMVGAGMDIAQAAAKSGLMEME